MVWRVIAGFLLAASLWAQPGMLDGFDSFVERQLKECKTPGAAVVVVHKGRVLLSKGYGLRDVNGGKQVTSKTLFAIASATKPFTALGIATLVHEGKLAWDTPVRKYLPDFRLYDPVATERITLRDMLSHRSGLPAYEVMYIIAPYTREDIYRRLRYLEPSVEFRSKWQYTNLMFMVAGYLQGKVDGNRTWEESLRRRILDPLGMTATNFSLEASRQSGDYALPYAEQKTGIVEAPVWNLGSIGPAGSINSSAEDMARFLRLLVDRGRIDGRALVDEAQLKQMESAQVSVPWEPDDPRFGQQCYGLGWFVNTYRGHKLVQHGGHTQGFTSELALLPNDGIGAVILTNRGGTPLPGILLSNIWDRALGAQREDRPEKAKPGAAKADQSEVRKEGTKPSHFLADYTGEYEHPGFGVLAIGGGGAGLTATFHNLTARLEHFHHDVFRCIDEPGNMLSGQKIQFRLNLDGDVDAALWDMEANVPRAIFKRREAKDERRSDRAGGAAQLRPGAGAR